MLVGNVRYFSAVIDSQAFGHWVYRLGRLLEVVIMRFRARDSQKSSHASLHPVISLIAT
jgi:hypothetical protein